MSEQLTTAVHLDLPRTDDLAPPRARWQRIGRTTVRVLKVILRIEITLRGDEQIPLDGPVILASNHIGIADGPVLWATAPRTLHALTKVEMFEGARGTLLRSMGQIPIDRSVIDPHAVRLTLRVLRDGGCAVVYPEGGRGIGDVVATKAGAAYLALVTGAPVIPVACLGTRADGAGISSSPPRRSRIDVVYGEPMQWPAEPWPRTKARVSEVRAVIQKQLHDHVVEACETTGQHLPPLGGQS